MSCPVHPLAYSTCPAAHLARAQACSIRLPTFPAYPAEYPAYPSAYLACHPAYPIRPAACSICPPTYPSLLSFCCGY